MSEEAKAVQEVAKASLKAIDAGSEIGRFIGRYVGGPIETAIGVVWDHLVYARWERRQRLIQRAEHFAAMSGIGERCEPMPLNVAVPLLSAASIEDDDYLQDEWAKLFVNAADPASNIGSYKSFVSILNSMSKMDALMLRAVIEAPEDYVSDAGYISTKRLPDAYEVMENKLDGEGDGLSEEVIISLYNLRRLGLIENGAWNPTNFKTVRSSRLGKAFVQACTVREPPVA